MSRRTKVGKDDVTICRNENVLWLEISVDDSGAVKSLDSFRQFRHIESSTITTQSTPASELRCQISSGVKVERKVESCSTQGNR